MVNKFDIIKNNYSNDILIIIFENKYKKNEVKINIHKQDMSIIYPDGQVDFINEDKDTLDIIKNAESINVVEIDLHEGKSKGRAIHNYLATNQPST